MKRNHKRTTNLMQKLAPPPIGESIGHGVFQI